MNRITISISLFTSPSNSGIELENMMTTNAKTILHEAFRQAQTKASIDLNTDSFDIKISQINSCGSEESFIKAQLEDDIVIFDGSIEDGNFRLGENYSSVSHAPYLMDNVIVVSRTMLPINYMPSETNAPLFGEEAQIENAEGECHPKRFYSNEEIIDYLKNTLSGWFVTGRLPRNTEYKRDLSGMNPSGRYLSREMSAIYDRTKGVKEKKRCKTAFISYRSYYKTNKSNGYSVDDVKQYIIDYHRKNDPDEEWKVLYYPQGSLAQDCMTEFRRWGLMTYVDNIFKEVQEVWIFNAHDTQYGPSYWDSWFTQGEIISLISLHNDLPKYCPKIYDFNPSNGNHREINLDCLPKIPDEQKDQLNAITTVAEIKYGDYGAVLGIQWLKEKTAKLPSLLKKLPLRMLSIPLKVDLVTHYGSRAYDKSFMSRRIVSCSSCLKTGASWDSFSDPKFISEFIQISSLDAVERAEIANRGYFSIDENAFANALSAGRIECPSCKKVFHLKESGEYLYLWRKNFKNPMMQFNGYIEKIPLHQISEG